MAELLSQYAAQVGDKVRRGVIEVFAAENPLLSVLRFQDLGDQIIYEYNREASLGGVGFRALNGEYSAAAKGVGIVNPIREVTAILGGEVPVDRQLYGNTTIRANKTAMKAKAAARFYVKNFLKGDLADDPKGFIGLYERMIGANIAYAGDNGGSLVLLDLDAIIDRVIGENAQKMLVMCAAMRRLLGAIVRAAGATQMSMAEWAGPTQLKSYNGCRIIDPSEDETGTDIMGFNEARGNSNVTGSIVCFRPGVNDEEHVVGLAKAAASGFIEVEEQGVRGTTGTVLVEGRAGMAVHHPRSAARYAGILNAMPAA
jgi:hypothetical protein